MKYNSKRAAALLLFFVVLIAGTIASAFICFADDYYTIRVEYKYSDNSVVQDPYVAVLRAESEVSLTVKNPIIPGYKPVDSLEQNANDASQTVLSYDSLDEDKTIVVYYVPDLVHYKVRYFMQNVKDDLYTENLSLDSSYYEKSGYTGSFPSELMSQAFSGFTSLFHEPDAIAADGSTVFKIYYDRNYYLVDFLLGEGGYGVDPVYAKHGTTYKIAVPKRSGYRFLGWAPANANGDFLDGSGNVISEETARSSSDYYDDFDSGTVPIGDTYYRAVWQPEDSKFNVVYWSENPGDDGYSVIAEKEITQVVVNSELVDVEADMTITPDTYIKNNAGTQNIKIKDFFGFNLNYADPDNEDNDDPESSVKYDTEENIIDFNDISKGVTEEYKDNGKLFELNTAENMPEGSDYITDTSVTVAGDGTTNINIYFKRRPFTLKFFYARVNNSTGAIDLTNSTKSFSRKSYSGTNYMSAVEAGTWESDIADTLPTLKEEYVAAGYIAQRTVVYNGYTYYYYQVNSKYNAPLKNKWFVDSINSVSKKGNYAESEVCVPGSWAVENGTNYYISHTTVGNFTIKGIYEKLGIELMFNNKPTDYTELHYLVSWTNTSKKVNWNYGINRVLRFKYQNYVELTNYERNILRGNFMMTEDQPDREIPSSKIFDPTKGDYIKEPATGKYIDLELVDDNELVSGTNAPYIEIVKFNSSNDKSAQPKLYGLKTTFEEIDSEVFDVDTVDSGDQYDRSKTEAVRTANVRSNQTPTDLTGYQIENYALNDKGQIILNSTNTTVDWSEDTDTVRRATIRFFYRRRSYNLAFRNGNNYEAENFTVHYGEYVNYTTAPQRLLIPAYYNADLRDYYEFHGWYFDPTYSDEEATAGFAMPSDDIILYAKWEPISLSVKFYNDYKAYADSGTPVNVASVPYNTKILTSDIPANEELASYRLTPKPSDARFAGWYYVDSQNNHVRFDPENLPVTRDIKLYAAWESTKTAKYKVKYVEKDTDNELAPADTGTLFVSKTKTFTAKTSDKFNEEHRWVEGQPNWWPTVSSHSILIEENDGTNDYSPNEFTFEYIRKDDPVNYAVQYVNADTNEPVSDMELKSTYYAAVTEIAPYIEGYAVDSVTKSLVLSASEKEGDEAVTEEIQNNVIIFFYKETTDGTAVYQLDHYIQNVEGDDYELYYSDTLYGTIDDILSVSTLDDGDIGASLTSSGFTFMQAQTTVSVNGGAAASAGDSITLTGEPTIISVYYDRSRYAYTVKYVDYEQEKLYDAEMEKSEEERDDSVWNGEMRSTTYTGGDKQPLGKDVVISALSAPSSYTYTGGETPQNYSKIGDSDPVITIRHDDPDTPAVNIIKIYYIKDKERTLNYRVVCDAETTDRYAVLSQSSEIVENAGGIRGCTVTPLTLDDHEYEFLGWFSTASPVEENRLTAANVYSYAPAVLPGADMTYYAVFSQKQVIADIEIRYNDTGVYTDDATAYEDTDGSKTGYTILFTTPDGYVSGAETALDKTGTFVFDKVNTDGRMYKYEFAGWYMVDLSDDSVTENPDMSSISRSGNCRYIAMFSKKTSMNCEIKYRFETRSYGVQDYTVRGTLSGDEMTAALNSSGSCELSDEYILSNAPFESNHGETLTWSDTEITRDSSDETDTAYAVITAVQRAKTVRVQYKLLPEDPFELIETTAGANRETDSGLEVINAEGLQYDENDFSYWEIRKSEAGEVIAKCYDPWFTFCVMDNYWITPVYEGSATAYSAPDYTDIKLMHLDYSRNRWNTEDEEGALVESGDTDLLYTDFEINFNNKNKLISVSDSGYRTGVVFELCAKLPDDKSFDSEKDYGFVSDITNLKAAILDGSVTKYKYSGEKQRSIQIIDIPTDSLTNKNRVEFGKGYKNIGNNKSYVLKATAYLIDSENNVTLSNYVYVCLSDVAAQNLALG